MSQRLKLNANATQRKSFAVRSIVFGALFACYLMPFYSMAQLSIGHFGQMTVNVGLTNTMNAATLAAAKKSKSKLPKTKQEGLRFEPSEKVSEQASEIFIESINESNPALAKELQKIITSQDLIEKFSADMEPYGLSSRNLADVLTAFFVTHWMVANQQGLPSKTSVTAVQNNISHGMAVNMEKLGNDQRQLFSELLIYQSLLALGAISSGDANPEFKQQIADEYHTNILAMGIDLRSLDITDAGLVAK